MKHPANRRFRLALAATILALAMSAAHADDAQIAYYDVFGSAASALRQQIDTKGPLDGGQHFDAHTKWSVKWNYQYRATPSGCKFTNVDVSVTGTILLPRWVDMDDAPAALVQKWNKYVAALRVHEDGHYVHGVSAAKEIQALAQSFHGSGNCSAMVSKFNGQARAIIDK